MSEFNEQLARNISAGPYCSAIDITRGLSPRALFMNLTLLNEINDIKLLPEFLTHENPLVQEAARKRQTYLMNRISNEHAKDQKGT